MKLALLPSLAFLLAVGCARPQPVIAVAEPASPPVVAPPPPAVPQIKEPPRYAVVLAPAVAAVVPVDQLSRAAVRKCRNMKAAEACDALVAYLDQFPEGAHASEAKAALKLAKKTD